MKNKRTKLTAILLSALMAVSTISSVTWAADLFSDGSEESGTVVDNPDFSISAVEDEGIAENGPITGVGKTDIDSVTFEYANNNVQAVIKTKDSKGTTHDYDKIIADHKGDKDPDCFSPKKAIYYITLKLEDEELVVYSEDSKGTDNSYGFDVNVPDTLRQWTGISIESGSEVSGTFTTVTPEEKDLGYINVPGSNPIGNTYGHDLHNPNGLKDGEGVHYVYQDASCNEEGLELVYSGCTYCGAYNDASITEKKDLKIPKWHDTPVDDVETQILEDPNTYKQVIEKEDHNYEGATPRIVYSRSESAKDTLGNPYTILKLYLYVNGFNDPMIGEWASNTSDPTSDYIVDGGDSVFEFAPYKCHIENGKMVPDSNEYATDAYYFTVLQCKNKDCKTLKYYSEEYLVDVPGKIGGVWYVQADGGNVAGFVGKDGKHYYFSDKDKDEINKKRNENGLGEDKAAVVSPNKNYRIKNKEGHWQIRVDILKDPVEPILNDCTKLYRFYIRSYESDTGEYVDVQVKGNDDGPYEVTHAWGGTVVVPEKKAFIDGTVSGTEDSKLLHDKDGNVVYDKVSKDCLTNAKYQEGQQCIVCGKYQKVGDLKETGYNGPHKMPTTWSNTTDDFDNEYYQIDENTHKKITYYHRTCELCGFRELKFANAFVESHNLQEKEVKDGDKKEPTCGEPGYYTVQLQCACGLKDTGSTKQTTIPATDKHDFGDNPVELIPVGDIHVGKNGDKNSKVNDNAYVVYAQVVRKCNLCEKYDSNGINNISDGIVGPNKDLFIDTINEGRTIEVTDAKTDANGVPYPCSVGSATITFEWSGKLNEKPVKPEPKTITVPYYPSELAYQGRRDHKPDDIRVVEKVDATADAPGHITRDIYCSVCGDYITTETTTIAQLGSAPVVKAISANYNTINVSWDAVENADSYRLYYKSSDVGVSQWKLVRNIKGTSFSHSGLVTGAKYRYTVRAVVKGVLGEFDRTGSVATPKLAAPDNLTVTAVSGKNKVSWSKVDGANGYIIQRSAGSGWTRVGSVKKGAKVTWTDKKPISGATYRVRAYRTVNDANFSKNNVYSAFSAAK